MLKKHFGVFALFCVVKISVRIHSVVTILKNRMTKNIVRFVVLVVPNKWNSLPITLSKRSVTNRSTV